ncbi:MAG: hypothetical protein QXP61_00970 [Nitrososphaerales archaeon]
MEQRDMNPYVVSYCALRAFEELIDAFTAQEGLHFHDEYPVQAWQNRVKWMHSKPDLLHEWNGLLELYSLVSVGNDGDKALKMMAIVRNRLDKIYS